MSWCLGFRPDRTPEVQAVRLTSFYHLRPRLQYCHRGRPHQIHQVVQMVKWSGCLMKLKMARARAEVGGMLAQSTLGTTVAMSRASLGSSMGI